MHHLETCLLIAEADRVLCHLVMFLTIFFHWMYKRILCYYFGGARSKGFATLRNDQSYNFLTRLGMQSL